MPTPPCQQRQTLRAILRAARPVQLASVFSPLSARLAQEAGFQAGFMGGSAVAAAHLAAPDVGALTLAQLADCLGRCADVSDLPLLTDGDDGHGNALSTAWTVRTLEQAGAAGVTIEDSTLPRAGGKSGDVIAAEEFAAKLAAAVAARASEMVIVGQTVVYPHGGADAARQRLQAMEDAGADAAMVYGLDTPEALRAMSGVTTLPLILAPLAPRLNDPALLARCRVAAVFHGHHPLRAAVAAMAQAYGLLAEDDAPGRAAATGVSAARMREILHCPEFARILGAAARG